MKNNKNVLGCSMNSRSSITYLILIIAPLFFGCHEPVKAEAKNIVPASPALLGQKYSIDTNESVVAWKGSMQIGSNSHAGYVYISKGELMIKNGQLLGGAAEVDMNTIEDDAHGRSNGLIDHLKDPDFFDVKKFPISTIVITGAASANGQEIKITGNLTIKGITHPVTFPAKMEVKDEIIKANGRLVIDRTQWGIRYQSGSLFGILADEVISDSIEFDIKIVAKK